MTRLTHFFQNLALGFALVGAAPLAWGNLVPINGIVAIVNDAVITQDEFNQALNAAKQQAQQNNLTLPSTTELKKEVLNQMIDQELELQLAKQNKIEVSEHEIDAAIERIAEQNHISVAELKDRLTLDHLPYTTFRHQLQKQILLSKVQQQAVAGSIEITDKDIQAFRHKKDVMSDATQYHVATLLLPSAMAKTPEEKAEQNTQIQHLIQKIRQSTRQHKAYAGSMDLGWQTLDTLPAVFAPIVSNMQPGEVKGPVSAPNGQHILQLLDKTQGESLTTDQIKTIVYQKKAQDAVQKWITQLKKHAYIHIVSNL